MLASLHETDARLALQKNSTKSREGMTQATSEIILSAVNKENGGLESSTRANVSKTIASILESRKKTTKGLYQVYTQGIKQNNIDNSVSKNRYNYSKYFSKFFTKILVK